VIPPGMRCPLIGTETTGGVGPPCARGHQRQSTRARPSTQARPTPASCRTRETDPLCSMVSLIVLSRQRRRTLLHPISRSAESVCRSRAESGSSHEGHLEGSENDLVSRWFHYDINMLALCDMRTLYLRNVPDVVVERLERLAARDATSVGAVAVRELAEVSRRADHPALLGSLPDLDVDVATIVSDTDAERAGR